MPITSIKSVNRIGLSRHAFWFCVAALAISALFAASKHRNDASIAADTKRIADAAERISPYGYYRSISCDGETGGSCANMWKCVLEQKGKAAPGPCGPDIQ